MKNQWVRAVESWRHLSTLKKLYLVVGMMACLIVLELVTLSFAITTLSSMRAFAAGEAMWSKGQKDAVLNLHKYLMMRDQKYFDLFQENLAVYIGDRRAREIMDSPNPNLEEARRWLLFAKNHPEDIDGLIRLYTRFKTNPYMVRAIDLWHYGDEVMRELEREGELARRMVEGGFLSRAERDAALERVYDVNRRLSVTEPQFSLAVGAGSRWVESVLLLVVIFVFLGIESTGLVATFRLSRRLSRELRMINAAARAIRAGKYEVRLPVSATDEISEIANTLNELARDLETKTGERNQAQRANRWKSLFLANMSHEIRTPLGAIMGFTELLRDPHLNETEKSRYLDIISRTGESLTKIVNDILDLSKVEAGKLEFNRVPFELREFIAEIYELMSVRALDKGVDFRFDGIQGELPTESGGKLFTDPLRLRQILVNLIGNAVKFTPQRGEVRVKFEIARGRFHFLISDTGPGIPEESQRSLFKPFSQGSRDALKIYAGTGLGLFLARKLARGLGGDVRLEKSGVGGTTFSGSVQVEPYRQPSSVRGASPPLVHPAPFESLAGKRILFVDDAVENRVLVQRLLAKRGAVVELASDGAEGVEKAKRADYDVVLMDMHMPILNGYQAVEKLRSTGYQTPIIALTAQAMKEDREKCLAVGCTDYLTKPIVTESLVATILHHTRNLPKPNSMPRPAPGLIELS